MLSRAALGLTLLAAVLITSAAANPFAPRTGSAGDFPSTTVEFTNDTGAAVSRLEIAMGSFSASLDPLWGPVPGCPEHTTITDALIPISRNVIAWPEECIEPGQSITGYFDIDCIHCQPPSVSSYTWSSTFVTLTNGSGAPTSTLRVDLDAPSFREPRVYSPPACADPHIALASPIPFTSFQVNWPSECVDEGADVTLYLFQSEYAPGDWYVGCTTCAQPGVASYSWTAGDKPGPTPAPAPTPTPTPQPGTDLTWGDVGCDGEIKITAAIRIARHLIPLAGIFPPDCPFIGAELAIDGHTHIWGDVDCNGAVTIGDAVKVARHVIGLPIAQANGCPEIGSHVTAYAPE